MAALMAGMAMPAFAVESWHCRNDLEIRCGGGSCAVAGEGESTPLSVAFADDGAISVCAYTGCWDGRGRADGDDRYLTVSARGLPFSTAPEDAPRPADVAVLLDRETSVALLHADGFALPLHCVGVGDGGRGRTPSSGTYPVLHDRTPDG
ncbi:hypothetical protein [Arenimonas composti]|uniref:Uncharacterized protein n=1 Tax=Arenimonas composti TR7-09 = DSM 18010 TaxID=1121013 RepID=A0A091BB09_9GAMM|nr:hypothetical protein [Arenimonas composti]KFN48697.1 hypothetical protein P873_13655 [Arenimonas composti TR7-09 = DSM 18010]